MLLILLASSCVIGHGFSEHFGGFVLDWLSELFSSSDLYTNLNQYPNQLAENASNAYGLEPDASTSIAD